MKGIWKVLFTLMVIFALFGVTFIAPWAWVAVAGVLVANWLNAKFFGKEVSYKKSHHGGHFQGHKGH